MESTAFVDLIHQFNLLVLPKKAVLLCLYGGSKMENTTTW